MDLTPDQGPGDIDAMPAPSALPRRQPVPNQGGQDRGEVPHRPIRPGPRTA
jgi:hypothetical protein